MEMICDPMRRDKQSEHEPGSGKRLLRLNSSVVGRGEGDKRAQTDQVCSQFSPLVNCSLGLLWNLMLNNNGKEWK